MRAGVPRGDGCNVEDGHVELLYYGEAAKLVYDRSRAPADGETLVAKMYLNGARRAVVQRDDDILTADELRKHAKEVRSRRHAQRVAYLG